MLHHTAWRRVLLSSARIVSKVYINLEWNNARLSADSLTSAWSLLSALHPTWAFVLQRRVAKGKGSAIPCFRESRTPYFGQGDRVQDHSESKKLKNCVLRRAGNNITEVTKIQGKRCNLTGNLGGLGTAKPGVCYQNVFMSKCTTNLNFT